MKRIFNAIVIGFSCFSCLYGQDYSAEFIGNINGNFLIRETRTHKLKQTHALVMLDPEMKILIKTNPAPSLKRNELVKQILQMDNKIVLITQLADIRADKLALYYSLLDPVTLQARNEKRILTESSLSEEKTIMNGFYTLSISEDHTKLLAVREVAPNLIKAKPKTFEVSVFDQDLHLLWHRKETLTLTDKQFKTRSYLVENTGDVVIGGRAKYDKDTVEARLLRNFAFLEFKGNGQNFSFRNLPMEVADYKITGDRVSFTKDKFIAGGFYKVPGIKRTYGYFLQVYDRHSFEQEKNYYHLLTRVSGETGDSEPESDKSAKNDADDLYVFDIKSLTTDNSGNYILVGEQNKTTIYTSQNNTTITEQYLDIFVLKLDPEGKLVWEQHIPKKQVFVPTKNKKAGNMYSFASYALATSGDNLLFFINDNPENLENTGRTKQVRWNKSVSQVLVIDKNGDIRRSIVSESPGYLLNNSFFINLSESRILTRFSYYRKYDKADYRILDLSAIPAP